MVILLFLGISKSADNLEEWNEEGIKIGLEDLDFEVDGLV